MKHKKNFLITILFVTLLSAMIFQCDKDDGTSSEENLIGTWELVELVINYEGIPANLLQFLGLEITLDVRDDDTYTITTLHTADNSTDVENGTWTAGSKTITINPDDGDPKTMDYSIDGNSATLKTVLPDVVDTDDEDLMSNVPQDMFNEDGTLKDTPVTLKYIKTDE